MKYIAYIGMLAIVLTALFSQMSNKFEVKNVTSVSTSTVEILEEEPSIPAEWEADAKAAYEAVIKKKQLEAELEQLNKEVSDREARITDIEKELGTY